MNGLDVAREDAAESTRQLHWLRADWSDKLKNAALRRLHSEQCHRRSGGIIPCGYTGGRPKLWERFWLRAELSAADPVCLHDVGDVFKSSQDLAQL